MEMFLIYCTAAILFFISVTRGQDEESLVAELQLADMELQDDCENLANALQYSLLTNNYTIWINAQKRHAQVFKDVSTTLMTYDYVPDNVKTNWTTLTKSGDSLLLNEELNILVSYYVGNEELMRTTKVHCDNKPQNCPTIKEVYQEVLQTNRNETLLKESWSSWQNLLYLKKKNFSSVLNLVHKAALQNEQSNAKSYWEMLVDLENAYEKADALWEEIQPLYLKLHNFVKTRILKFYNIEDTDSEIPVYLLGSNYGHDWSYIADLVLPHPQIYYIAKKYLNKKSIRDIYKLAENLTEELSLGDLGANFWKNSDFTLQLCENHVLSFCSQEYSEVLSCNKTSWVTYLDAFETALDIAVRNTNYLTFPRSGLRYSVIAEAVKTLGSTLAITNMRFNSILDQNLFSSTENDENPNKMTELLLVALRVLPQLPFYLAADRWRLELLETSFQEIDTTWWKHRKDLQGVRGIFNNESDYLGEPRLISNQPYLSKFYGIILQFQLLQYYQLEMTDLQGNVASHIGQDESFLSLIHNRLSSDWSDVIDRHLYISELYATPLLDYFQPLKNYLETAPLEQQSSTTGSPKLVVNNLHLQNVTFNATKTESRSELEQIDGPKPTEITNKGSNEDKDQLIMYFGIGIVIAAVVVAIVSKIARRKKTNRNRFET